MKKRIAYSLLQVFSFACFFIAIKRNDKAGDELSRVDGVKLMHITNRRGDA